MMTPPRSHQSLRFFGSLSRVAAQASRGAARREA